MTRIREILSTIGILVLLILLTSCAPKEMVLTETKPLVIKPPASMYDCPTIKTWPKTEGMTDVDVAKLILRLYNNNETCKHSLDAIQKYLDEAEHQSSK